MSATLADHTTSRVGGPVDHWVTATTEQEAIEAVRAADAHRTPLLVLGGGSNTLMADAGFPGTAVKLAFTGVETIAQTDAGVTVRMAAGQDWDEAVAATVARGLSGLEALSGIPGSAGATPVQNVGAYGADVSRTLVSLRAWDRRAGEIVELTNEQLQFGYRDSVIKRSLLEDLEASTPRWVVLSVDFRLRATGTAAPVRYAQLARALGVAEGDTAPLQAVRDEVLRLRAGKGMVLDHADPDTWSTGSFFTNPLVPAAVRTRLPQGAPAFGAGTDADGVEQVKLSAAWLIEHAGFGKGYGLGADETHLAGGRASLSTKHTLAVTNRGEASTEDLLAIARTVRDGVEDAWGVRLHPEPVLVGCCL